VNIIETRLPGVHIIEPKVYGDNRGYFLESYHEARYKQAGVQGRFVQDNHSRSSKGTLRGLHYQRQKPQGKLVRITQGEVFDVAVDVRRDSPFFGKWVGVHLSGENYRQLWVPPGFAHGFCVLSDTADFLYKCTEYYDPEDEEGVAWNDPSIGIEWPIQGPLLSKKDSVAQRLNDIPKDKLPKYTA